MGILGVGVAVYVAREAYIAWVMWKVQRHWVLLFWCTLEDLAANGFAEYACRRFLPGAYESGLVEIQPKKSTSPRYFNGRPTPAYVYAHADDFEYRLVSTYRQRHSA